MSSKQASSAGPFTGRHFTLIMVGFFGVVMAVNFVMAGFASSTFGGVVVDNSYVASQRFNGWLDQARVQAGLGWSAKASRLADGRVVLTFSGTPDAGLTVVAVARHPLGRMPDAALTFERDADGRFVSKLPLPLGRWRLRVSAQAGPDSWRQELDLS
jgi:nitrogen fixation protein FixH